MLVLDLTDLTNSEIKYEINKFPDGQQSISIPTSQFYPRVSKYDTNKAQAFKIGDTIKIHSHLNSFQDLELIICAKKILDNLGTPQVVLHVPYFLGARSDRRFEEGTVHYLKEVICPIINSLKFAAVVVLDPHSDVLEACLDNIVKVDNHLIVKHALTAIDNKNDARDRICLVSPDAGAYKKIFDVAKKFEINNVITATKVRDLKTGKILHTEVPLQEAMWYKDVKFVIVDDICDGGRTFIEIAKAIRDQLPNAKIYLIVTHGIFSAGEEPLKEYFEHVYTTNSVKEGESDFVTRFNVFK
ncbi:PrsA Phosphoribosylpyrophosphate synthetase [uncultured Caudovirales phage]|uniref:PrsA Phosphoribosylpyrophosphate synthetase n=1 Tax=uncultured Caudovirales phage TaxID=2100421 RepID=A0A6J5PI47_9CAUD|nr:PrsA Phosphoribosylpyrophosphate synthetase [uncultured Caudovirales phage]CAB4170767.1 PrsA Phosphoribosylpyrophosphate synthetase [uncultured Caudovirales phage]CAB4198454.1 PrsA Phosphoribosylpyrophosphate synthetase [uncultured Caudovirales phage]